MSNLTAADTADWQNQTEGQGRSGRSGSGRHRTSRSPERQVMYSQQQAEQLRRKQQQQQGQPRQQHPQHQQHPQQMMPQQYGGAGQQAYAPTTGQFRSGHIEVDTLYSGQDPSSVRVNSMNAPNNSTMQCGCENIDCPFCNLMTSVQMSS